MGAIFEIPTTILKYIVSTYYDEVLSIAEDTVLGSWRAFELAFKSLRMPSNVQLEVYYIKLTLLHVLVLSECANSLLSASTTVCLHVYMCNSTFVCRSIHTNVLAIVCVCVCM